ncbi:hypothetical protein [Leptospira harrisiae]|uniref:hypothetical protein n=1 Tax=Leptospira harrisiae TaxID=2023189 RepID=UPI001FAEE792|nr:hypothetical protein [Leptospira harrisiae]
MVHAKNGTSLYQITKELNSILENHKDWVLLYTSQQDFFDDLYHFFILFLFLDLIFFFVPFFYPVEWEFIFVSLLSFYIVLVIFLGICCLLLFPIGRSILFLFLVWKYFLVLFPIRRMGKWVFSFFISFSLLWFFIILNWVPKIFGLLFLVHLYFLLLVPFTRNLLQSFSKKGNPSLKFSFREIYHSHKEMFTREIKSSKKKNLILPLFLLMMGVLVSFFSSFGLQTVVAPYGSIQMGRLEFPTSLPEQESIRITKQVESVILMRKITDFLVVKQNPSNAIFYFRLNELGRKIGFQNLPIEPGYFHLLGESDVNSDRKIRFSNANTEILEKTILWLTPWIRTKKEVEEVVLCFQPSAEGLDLQTSAYYRNMLGLDWDDSLRERSIELQSSIVGKMILDKKLIDIRFVAKQEKKLERYPTKPTKMNLGIPVFTSSLSNYETVKTPARIYRKNGETSLEILVKGKSIHWEELESEMKQFLAKEKVQFTVIAPLKESLPKYRPIFFLLAFSLFLYRKKNKPFWLVSICVLFLLWKIDVSVLGADYFLFGSVASFIFFLLTWFPQTSFHWKLFIPFFLLLTLSYILPGEGGRFFMGGFLLISIFFLLYFKIWQKWRIMKTKLIF